jgi:hypothetical protein
MGFIGKLRARRATKKGQGQTKANVSILVNHDGDSIVKSSSHASSSSNADSGFKKRLKKLSSFRAADVTMDHLPDLILELEVAQETSSSQSSRVLKILFSLSESAESQNRIDMVAQEEGRLVPALLNFLVRCAPKSSEQYLTLLVLNNISIPAQTKRVSSLPTCTFCVRQLLILECPAYSFCFAVFTLRPLQ